MRAAVDVDLDIRRGETLGIVGESGSGKSTVARCIARLIDPSEGLVFLGKDEIATMSARSCARTGGACKSSSRIPIAR